MHTHTVFFWLKGHVGPQERAVFRKGLEHLVKDPKVLSATIGEPAQTDRDVVENSYDFAVIAAFQSLKDHNAYQVGAHHDAFLKECQDLWARVQVFDIQSD